MSPAERYKELKKKWRDLNKDPKFRATWNYFGSALIVILATFFASTLSLALPSVSLETSARILENVIRLDGVLFGFTGVMLALIYREAKSPKTKAGTTFLTTISFFCYLLSIFMSFSFLMQQMQSNGIFVPVLLTCFGGLCSSIYIIMVFIEMEKEE